MQPSRFLFSMLLMVTFTAIVSRPVHAQDINAQDLSIDILHAFSGPPDGVAPNPVIRDAEGNLYGTTAGGGEASCPGSNGAGCGTVFEVTRDGQYTVLYRFLGGDSDGAFPTSGVTRDAAGNLFGTTQGANGAPSTIYEIKRNGEEKILRYLGNANFADGAAANSAPVLDAKGNLFGNTWYGGDPSCGFNGNGCGVVYEVEANGKFRVLYTFTSLADGIEPYGSPVIDSQGNIFGVTGLGGILTCNHPNGCGVVYELDHTGKYKILHKFTGKSDGAFPGCVIDDGAGNLLGITNEGGDLSCFSGFGCGTIFRMNKAGKFKTLYQFTPFTENNAGHSCLVLDSQGNIYNTNYSGGAHNGGYLGMLDAAGKYTVLYSFAGENSTQGGFPQGVVLGPNGEFFGATVQGGDLSCGPEETGCGTVFELVP